MMFMTSVSAYSQSTEEVIYVDVAVNAPGLGLPWCVWWRDVPLVIKGYENSSSVELNLDLGDGLIIDHYHSGGTHWYTCINAMTYYMNKALATRFGVSGFYIAPAGHLPFPHWY